MNVNYRIQLLEEAGDLIAEAIGKIDEALEGTSHHSHALGYIIPHLNTWIGNGNRYDTDVYKYIEYLKGDGDEEYEEDEDDENEFRFT